MISDARWHCPGLLHKTNSFPWDPVPNQLSSTCAAAAATAAQLLQRQLQSFHRLPSRGLCQCTGRISRPILLTSSSTFGRTPVMTSYSEGPAMTSYHLPTASRQGSCNSLQGTMKTRRMKIWMMMKNSWSSDVYITQWDSLKSLILEGLIFWLWSSQWWMISHWFSHVSL